MGSTSTFAGYRPKQLFHKKQTLLWKLCFVAFSVLMPFSKSFSQASGCDCSNFNLINPDFESGATPSSWTLVDDASIPNGFPGWRTTASDKKIEVWHGAGMGVPAYSGTYFVELNANQASTLYQNVNTCPGQVYSYKVAHRARSSNGETVKLEVGPVGGPFTTLATMVGKTTEWGVYSGNYTVPVGQTVTELRLTATVPSTGAVGNLIDAFSFAPTFCGVNSLPLIFNVSGGGAFCSGGIGVNVSINGSQSNVSYQLVLNGNTVGTAIAGNGSAITFTQVTAAGNYSVRATTAAGSMTMDGTATVTVNPLPTPGKINDVTVTVGGPNVPTTFATQPTGAAPFTYDLDLNGAYIGQMFVGQLNTPAQNTIRITGVTPNSPATYPVATATNLSSSLSPTTPSFTTNYDLRVTDANGCVAATTSPVKVTLSNPTIPAGALNFDGVNDRVTLPNINPIASGKPGEYTVEAMVNIPSYNVGEQSNNFGVMIYGDERNGNGGIIMQIGYDGRVWTYAPGAGFKFSNYKVPLNTWTHLAFVQDANNLKLFANGVFIEDLLSAPFLHKATNEPEYIGAFTTDHTTFSRNIRGSVDEVRVWNRALCQGELQNNRTGELAIPQNGLVAYYKMNQGFVEANNTSITNVLDASGNGNNASPVGFERTGATSNFVAGHVTGTAPAFVGPAVSASSNSPLVTGQALNLTADGNSGIYVWTGPNNRTFSVQNPTINPVQATDGGIYTVTRTVNGCTASSSTNVVVNTPPVAVCKSGKVSVTNNCQAVAPALDFDGGSTDADGDALTFSVSPAGPYGLGITNVTLTVMDSKGASSTCNTTITVEDKTAPTITPSSNLTVTVPNGQCDVTVSVPAPAVTDNCSSLTLGNALNFDGVNDIAFVNSTSAINQTQGKRTAEVWFKVNDKNISSRKQVIWEEGATANGLNLYVYNGSLYAGVYSENLNFDGAWVSTPAIQSGQWHNAVLVFDGSKPAAERIKAYLDGVLFGTASSTASALNQHPGENAVGGMYNGGKFHDGDVATSPLYNHFFGGDIDEIRLWTTARTEAELAANVYKKLTGTEPGLTVYYDFDQGVACGVNSGITQLLDRTATKLNGTFQGFNFTGATCNSNFTTGSPALSSSITLVNSKTNSADASSTYPIGTTTVTWTATDAAGNPATATQTVTVLAPEINLGGAGNSITAGSNSPSAANGTDFGGTTPGNPIVKTFTIENAGTSPLTVSSITKTGAAFSIDGIVLPVTIATGNSATFNVTFASSAVGVSTGSITINNNDCDEGAYTFAIAGEITCTNPVLGTTLENRVVDATAACTAIVTYTVTANGIPEPTYSYSFAGNTVGSGNGTGSGSTFNKGITTVTITATNACGSVSQSFNVEVKDVTAPTLLGTAPASVTAPCSNIPSAPSVSAIDNCDPSPVVTLSTASTQNSDAAQPGHYNYTLTRTWKAKDAAGNEAVVATQVVTVEDKTAPNITCPAPVTVNTGSSNELLLVCERAGRVSKVNPSGTRSVFASVASADGIVFENKDFAIVSQFSNPSRISRVNIHTGQTTLIATLNGVCQGMSLDGNGNVLVANEGAKKIQRINLATGAVTDVLTGLTRPIDVVFENNNTILVSEFNGGTVLRYQLNASTTPTILANGLGGPTDIFVESATSILVAELGSSRITRVNLTNGQKSLIANTPGGSHGIAKDADGNLYIAQYTSGKVLKINPSNLVSEFSTDFGNPVFVAINPNGGCFASVTLSNPTAADNCSAVTLTNNAPPVYPVGTTTVTWTAKDASGNMATCEQTVVVADNEKPFIGATSDIHVNASAGKCGRENLAFSAPLASDNCGIQSVVGTRSDNLGLTDTYPIGTTTITWTATDIHQNVSTNTQQIVVRDVELPTIACTANINAVATSAAGAVVNYSIPVGTDNCLATTERIAGLESGATFPIGTTAVTYKATDAAGLTAECSFTITIKGVLPTIVCPSNIVVNSATGQCGANVNFAATETTGIPASTITYSHQPGSFFPVGVTTVTATATNAVGTSTCTFTVEVKDSEKPVLTPAASQNINLTSTCSVTIPDVRGTATDNCSNVTITQSPAIGTVVSSLHDGAITVTVTATDAAGLTDVKTVVLTAKDVTAPAFSTTNTGNVPASILANVPEAAQYNLVYKLNMPNAANWDKTSDIVYATNNASTLAGLPFSRIAYYMELQTGTTSKWVWVSMDKFTNNVSAIGIPTGTTVFQQKVSNMNVFASSNAGVTSGTGITNGNIEFWADCYNPGNFLGLLNANSGRYDFDDVRDNSRQNCYGSFQVHNYSAKQTVFAYNNWSGSGNSDIGIGNNPNGTANGQHPDWTFSNNAGNYTVKSLYAFINNSNSDITANTDPGLCAATVAVSSPISTDNCGTPTVTGTRSDNQPLTAKYPRGVTTITWTATDAAGNTATQTQMVTVTDAEKPVITTDGNKTVGNDAGVCGTVVTVSATATDNCSVATPTGTRSDGLALNAVYPVGTTTITWNVTDANGNAATPVTQTVTVNDTEKPQVTTGSISSCFKDVASAQAAAIAATTSYSDNCTAKANLLVTASTVGTCTAVITVTVKDASGNSQSVAYNTKIDNTAPVLSATPTNATVNCNSIPAAPSITATDNCDGSVIVAFTETTTKGNDPSKIAYYNYTITRTWSTQDGCGNATSATQIITVQDVTKPTIVVPTNVTVNCQDNTTPAVLGTATGTDNCSSVAISVVNATTQSSDPTSAAHYNYTITRTWTATDASGNATSGNQVITVQDVTKPTLVIPANVTVNCQDDKSSSATGTAAGSDNCSPVSITQSDATTQHSDPNNAGHYNYTINRTWTATDIAGNSESAIQVITVQDLTKPVITVPTNVTVNCQDDNSSLVTGVATGTDNCSAVAISQMQTSTQDSDVNNAGHYNYVIIRTWTATDASGNTTSASQTITVQDVTKPVITVPVNATVNCQDNTNPSALGNATGTDNCSPVAVSYVDATTKNADVNNAAHYNYTITRTWTITDVSGNATSADQLITVQDVTKPTLVIPANTTVNCQDDKSRNATGVATATDNCSPVSISHSDVTTQNADPNNAGHYNYTISRTWTVADVSGNTETAVQLITVQDVTKPIMTVPANVTVNCQDNSAASALASAAASDNCSPVTIAHSDASTQNPNASNVAHYNYSIIRTWTATDVSGNAVSDIQTITVQDVTKPVVKTKNVTVTLVNGVASINVPMLNDGSSDNCSPLTYSLSKLSFNCENLGQNTVTLTATDVSGNTASATAIVTVVGVIPSPAITVSRTNSTYTGLGTERTVFIGYGAQSLTLSASNGTSTQGNTQYSWSPATHLSTASGIATVYTPNPGAVGHNTVTVTATNEFGCIKSSEVVISVVDSRCGPDLRKVQICHTNHNNLLHENTICIDASAVDAHLKAGCTLNECASGAVAPGNVRTRPAKAFGINVAPNPTVNKFRIAVEGSEERAAELKVFDIKGRLIEIKRNIRINSVVEVGASYRSGIYIAEVTQGSERKQLRLVKIAD